MSTDAEPEVTEADPYADPYRQVLNPLELPANTTAAYAYPDPTVVDESKEVSPEQESQALAAIQDHVDQMAAMGTPIVDPRLGNTIPDPVLTAIDPTSMPVGPPQNTTLTAIGENFTLDCKIAFGVFSQGEADMGLGEAGAPKWEQTTFQNTGALTTVITGGLFPGADDNIPVSVGVPPDTTYGTETFAFTADSSSEPQTARAASASVDSAGDELAIDAIEPSSAPANTATDVTITGAGLAGTTRVHIGKYCANVVADDNEVTCTTAVTVAAGEYPVELTIEGEVWEGPSFTFE